MQGDLKTPQEVKDAFGKAGISIGAWAKQNNFHRQAVYAVLNGQYKAKYGQAHAIAVALGLKHGEVKSVESFLPASKAA